jgi:hypothetical protein
MPLLCDLRDFERLSCLTLQAKLREAEQALADSRASSLNELRLHEEAMYKVKDANRAELVSANRLAEDFKKQLEVAQADLVSGSCWVLRCFVQGRTAVYRSFHQLVKILLIFL